MLSLFVLPGLPHAETRLHARSVGPCLVCQCLASLLRLLDVRLLRFLKITTHLQSPHVRMYVV